MSVAFLLSMLIWVQTWKRALWWRECSNKNHNWLQQWRHPGQRSEMPMNFSYFVKRTSPSIQPMKTAPITKEHFLGVPGGRINRTSAPSKIAAVNRTRQIHSVLSVHQGKTATRNLSCFCQPCQKEPSGKNCINKAQVELWRFEDTKFTHGTPNTMSFYIIIIIIILVGFFPLFFPSGSHWNE